MLQGKGDAFDRAAIQRWALAISSQPTKAYGRYLGDRGVFGELPDIEADLTQKSKLDSQSQRNAHHATATNALCGRVCNNHRLDPAVLDRGSEVEHFFQR